METTVSKLKKECSSVSYIGFKSVKQNISGNKKINICSKEVASLLGEVVILKNVD